MLSTRTLPPHDVTFTRSPYTAASTFETAGTMSRSAQSFPVVELFHPGLHLHMPAASHRLARRKQGRRQAAGASVSH